jgi:SAM-dependent methyltransferase
MYARYLNSARRILRLIIKRVKIQVLAKKYKEATINEKEAKKYKEAAVDYPKRLQLWARDYLFTKPFDRAWHKEYSAQFFYHFANILKILELPPKAKILDVACGPGWLCEFLGRSGYDVTGIDISPDMIEIAEERIKAIKFGPQEGQPLQIKFLVGDAETTDLGSDFYHAAIFYDGLHHFTEPLAVLERVMASLKSGGILYVQEGIKPGLGSEDEQVLIEGMNHFGTLEKPFDQPELFGILKKVGFVNIQAYEAVNLIVKRDGKKIKPSLKNSMVPMTNTVVANLETCMTVSSLTS